MPGPSDRTAVETAPPPSPIERVRRARNIRRIGIVLLTVFVLLGASGFLGVRSATVSATGAGYTLTVTYGAVLRPGVAAPWLIEVRRAEGFDGPVTISTTAEYLELFDENGLNPDPASAVTSGRDLVWEFDPPDGDALRISFDARLGPAVQLGKSARTAVVVDGVRQVEVEYTSRVMP